MLAAARFGGDVPGALAAAARQAGAEGLLGLAACWRVAVDQGAGLAAGLDRLEGPCAPTGTNAPICVLSWGALGRRR